MADRVSFARGSEVPTEADPGRLFVQTETPTYAESDSVDFVRGSSNPVAPSEQLVSPQLYVQTGQEDDQTGPGDVYLDYTDVDSGQITRIQLTDNRKLNKSEAVSNYLKILDAQEIYLSKDEATNTYLSMLTGGLVQGELKIGSEAQYIAITGQGVSSAGNIDVAAAWRSWLNAASPSEIAELYLTKADASSMYLTQSSASALYLTVLDAATLYLNKADAAATYLSKTDAQSTYLSKADAATLYAPVAPSGDSYATRNWVGSQGYATQQSLSNYVLSSQLDMAVSSLGYIKASALDDSYVKLHGGGHIYRNPSFSEYGSISIGEHSGGSIAFFDAADADQDRWNIDYTGPGFPFLAPREKWISSLHPLISGTVSYVVDSGHTADAQVDISTYAFGAYDPSLPEGLQISIIVGVSFTAATILFKLTLEDYTGQMHYFYGQISSGGYNPASVTYPANSVFSLVCHNNTLYPATMPFPEVSSITIIDDGVITQ